MYKFDLLGGMVMYVNNPQQSYELAKAQQAERIQQAEIERLVRQASGRRRRTPLIFLPFSILATLILSQFLNL